MRYAQSPQKWKNYENPNDGIPILLCGSVTGENWQNEMLGKLDEVLSDDFILLNPRRPDFNSLSLDEIKEQTEWEYFALNNSAATIFWFAPPTDNPITLYEYGKQLARRKRIFVGCHKDYSLIRDIKIQTSLELSNQLVLDSIDDVLTEVKAWAHGKEFEQNL